MKTKIIIYLSYLLLFIFAQTSFMYAQQADSSACLMGDSFPCSERDSAILSLTDNTQQIINEPDTQMFVSDKTEQTSKLSPELTQVPDVGGLISFSKIFWSVVFILLGYFFLKLFSGLLSLYAERKPRHKTKVRRILPIAKIVVWSMIIYIVIAGIFAPAKETVLAFFASIGIAIGFASQDLMKNLFGGLMILFDNPFQIGDKIEIGKHYGEVREIGIRSTRILTSDDNIVSVPNSEIMNQSIANTNSGDIYCQVTAQIYLPHLIDTGRVRQIATEVAQISKYVYLNRAISVSFFSDKTDEKPILKMLLKAYVIDINYESAFKSELTELVLCELKKEGLMNEY